MNRAVLDTGKAARTIIDWALEQDDSGASIAHSIFGSAPMEFDGAIIPFGLPEPEVEEAPADAGGAAPAADGMSIYTVEDNNQILR